MGAIKEFSDCVVEWAKSLSEKIEGVIAIDCKTLRRSYRDASKKNPLHVERVHTSITVVKHANDDSDTTWQQLDALGAVASRIISSAIRGFVRNIITVSGTPASLHRSLSSIHSSGIYNRLPIGACPLALAYVILADRKICQNLSACLKNYQPCLSLPLQDWQMFLVAGIKTRQSDNFLFAPLYCLFTPRDFFPCFKNPVSSTTSIPSSSPSFSPT
jgi:hypothetical protein